MNNATITRVKEWANQLETLLPTTLLPASELVQALRRDHDDLRRLLEVLKSDKPIATRRNAFKKFVPLLQSHAEAEERAVYEATVGFPEMRKKTFEGYVEHDVADALITKIRTLRSAEKWTAAVQVLGELVEHHLDEEEREFFPKLDRLMAMDRKLQAEALYLELRDERPDHAVKLASA